MQLIIYLRKHLLVFLIGSVVIVAATYLLLTAPRFTTDDEVCTHNDKSDTKVHVCVTWQLNRCLWSLCWKSRFDELVLYFDNQTKDTLVPVTTLGANDWRLFRMTPSGWLEYPYIEGAYEIPTVGNEPLYLPNDALPAHTSRHYRINDLLGWKTFDVPSPRSNHSRRTSGFYYRPAFVDKGTFLLQIEYTQLSPSGQETKVEFTNLFNYPNEPMYGNDLAITLEAVFSGPNSRPDVEFVVTNSSTQTVWIKPGGLSGQGAFEQTVLAHHEITLLRRGHKTSWVYEAISEQELEPPIQPIAITAGQIRRIPAIDLGINPALSSGSDYLWIIPIYLEHDSTRKPVLFNRKRYLFSQNFDLN